MRLLLDTHVVLWWLTDAIPLTIVTNLAVISTCPDR